MNDENSPGQPVAPEVEIDAANAEDQAGETALQEPDTENIDVTPTPPEPPKPVSSGVWAMPDPVFKKTSGYLPQAFNAQFDPVQKGNEDTTVEQPKPDISMPQAAAVEPQPDVIEEGLLEPAISAQPLSPPQKKGVFGRILMILLALAIIVLMAAVVVGVIWFVFWPQPDATIN
jgi:hypothetical protein